MVNKVFDLSDLQRILHDCAGAEEGAELANANLDTTFEDLGYDSIALLETLGVITRECGVTIDDDTLTVGSTPRELIEMVNAR